MQTVQKILKAKKGQEKEHEKKDVKIVIFIY